MATRQRLVEVGARRLRVIALGRAGAEDGLGGDPVLRLALQLLVCALLELRDRREGADLHLHLDLLLLGHRRRVSQTVEGR